MYIEIKELSPRQRAVVVRLAEGMPPTLVAEATGFSREHVSRLKRSPAGQAELARLREEVERRLAAELPGLVEGALGILKTQLASPVGAVRADAAKFILRHLGRPFLEGAALANSRTSEVQDVETDSHY